ncbi:MAG: thiamine pyrophosphate-dependent enzyme, partial [Dehalococcoidia bacterium]
MDARATAKGDEGRSRATTSRKNVEGERRSAAQSEGASQTLTTPIPTDAEEYAGPPRVRIPLQEPHPERSRRAGRAKETHPHFGLPNEALVEMWYLMLLTRKLNERWFTLNRQGRAPFVITGQGQEATQVGTAAALMPGKDWVMPYYRDLGVVLTLGMTPDEIMLDVFAKADNPNSGGRQMPTHWSQRDLRIVSS